MPAGDEVDWREGRGKARSIGDRYKLYYSGGGRSKNGVAICLGEEWQDKVIATERKSDRIMSLRLVTPDRTYNVVSTYAPQQGCEDAEKERFWNQLDTLTRIVPENEELILAGDVNGYVGKDGSEEWARWHGGKSAGSRNEEGELILDFVWRKCWDENIWRKRLQNM